MTEDIGYATTSFIKSRLIMVKDKINKNFFLTPSYSHAEKTNKQKEHCRLYQNELVLLVVAPPAGDICNLGEVI